MIRLVLAGCLAAGCSESSEVMHDPVPECEMVREHVRSCHCGDAGDDLLLALACRNDGEGPCFVYSPSLCIDPDAVYCDSHYYDDHPGLYDTCAEFCADAPDDLPGCEAFDG